MINYIWLILQTLYILTSLKTSRKLRAEIIYIYI